MLILNIAVLALISESVLGQKAFLLTSSVGYYNYRQQANVMEVYQLLK